MEAPGVEGTLAGGDLLGRGPVGSPAGGDQSSPGERETSHWGEVERGSELHLEVTVTGISRLAVTDSWAPGFLFLSL